MIGYLHMIEKYTRKLTKASSHSYVITIPKELIKKFKWREKQKLEIVANDKTQKLTIRDWVGK